MLVTLYRRNPIAGRSLDLRATTSVRRTVARLRSMCKRSEQNIIAAQALPSENSSFTTGLISCLTALIFSARSKAFAASPLYLARSLSLTTWRPSCRNCSAACMYSRNALSKSLASSAFAALLYLDLTKHYKVRTIVRTLTDSALPLRLAWLIPER